MFHTLETALLSLIHTLPLEWFVFIGSFVEEVVAPIPSMAILLATGSFAAVQERALVGLVPLVLLAALGKTFGAILVYVCAQKIGGVFVQKFGQFFDVSEADVARFGTHITGTKRDYLLLTLFRALPIIPSVLVSVGGGILKLPLKLFLITTLIGSIIRDSIFVYVGYTGTTLLQTFAESSASIESVVQVVILVFILLGIGYLYFRRRKQTLRI
jgi:membrane protein DedA with SNARE-associated domain